MNNDTEASLHKIQEVAQLGEAQGLWKVTAVNTHLDSDRWRFVDVVTPEGLTFSLSGGSWNQKGAISCRVASLKSPKGISVSPSQVQGYREESAPDASCAHTRPAAAIVKDFYRRVVNHDHGRAIARKVLERLQHEEAQHAALRAHIETLSALGFQALRLDESATYQADMWSSQAETGVTRVRVFADGRVTLEAELQAGRVAELLALLRPSAP